MGKTKEKVVTNSPLTKKELRKQKRIERKQKRNFERYGIRPGDIKNKSTKTNWQALKQCFSQFKPLAWMFVLILICSLITVACSLINANFTQKMIDCVNATQLNSAIYYALFIAITSIISILSTFIFNITANRSFSSVMRNLRSEVMDHVLKTKTKKFDAINSGEIISRINKDTSTFSKVLNDLIVDSGAIIRSVGFIVYFFALNIWLGLIIVGTILIFTLFDTIKQKYVTKMRKQAQYLSDKNIGYVSEIVRSIRDIKTLNTRKNVEKNYLDNINYMKKNMNDTNLHSNLLSICSNIVLAIINFLFLFLCIKLWGLNIISFGAFIIFLMYKSNSLSLINQISKIRSILKTTSISAERICEILDNKEYPKEKFGRKRIKNPRGKIEFKNVSFAYNAKTKVFENFNLTIPANKTVAIVGKSGHGKSTLINLIPKLYEIQSGQILIDGINITKLSEDGLRDLVTIVPQTPYIFNTSIRENLSIVKPDMTEKEMIDVCKKAQIHDSIINKEKGYDSIVGENGIILSGGQKQRIAIARALLKNSKIILLDEATSALDNESQAKIKEALDKLGGKHTIVIVAHRLSTVADADKIIVIEKGKIVGEGTQEELLKNCDAFKKLYNTEKNKIKKLDI